MKVSVDKNLLKNKITEFIDNGNLAIENDKIIFYGESITSTSRPRLCDILLYADKKEYSEAACRIICISKFKMCHFTPMILSKIFLEYEDKLDKAAKTEIKEYLLSVKEELMGDELDFVGVNDNFPMMSTFAVMAMSKIFDDNEMLFEAERRFNQLEALLKRRGVISEYNSLTYTPLQLFVTASLARAALNEKFKEIALNAQQRIWFDFISHCHRTAEGISGPYSRHYAYVNASNPYNSFIYPLLDRDKKSILDEYRNPMAGNVESLYYLTEEYEISKEILDLYTDKKYPFEFKATTEYSASTDATPEAARRDMSVENDTYEYTAGVSGLYTYQAERYGIGTATKEWHNGVQTSSFTLEYKADYGDKSVSRNIWCRYLLNDERKEKQPFFDQGRKMAFGKKNKAVVLYKPKVAAIPAVYAGLPKFLEEHYKKQEVSGNNGVTSAKLSVIIPLSGVDVEEIRVGNEKISGFSAEFSKPQSVYIKDGGVFCAYHPLSIDDKGRKYAMSIRKRDDKLEIAFYNYFGEKKDFAKREFLHVRNGFAVSVNSVDEVSSFDEFVKKEEKTKISDRFITTNHSRQTYIREVVVKSEEMKLSCEYSPASEGIKNIACNDYPIEFPKLYATGFDIKTLPFIEE